MRTSYVSKNAEERELKKKREAVKKQQKQRVNSQLSDVYSDLKTKSNNVPKKPTKKKSKKLLISVIVILSILIGVGVYCVAGVNSGENYKNSSEGNVGNVTTYICSVEYINLEVGEKCTDWVLL